MPEFELRAFSDVGRAACFTELGNSMEIRVRMYTSTVCSLEIGSANRR